MFGKKLFKALNAWRKFKSSLKETNYQPIHWTIIPSTSICHTYSKTNAFQNLELHQLQNPVSCDYQNHLIPHHHIHPSIHTHSDYVGVFATGFFLLSSSFNVEKPNDLAKGLIVFLFLKDRAFLWKFQTLSLW